MNLVESFRLKWDVSLFSIIVTNIVVIILAIVQKWDVGTVFYIYLWQTIFLWFFTLLKLLFKKNISFIGAVNSEGQFIPIESEGLAKFQVIVGQLTWVLFFGAYFLFIYLLFNPPILSIWMIIVLILFFINHLISFIYYFKKDENKEELAKDLIKITGYRIIVIHMTIWLSGLFLHFISKTGLSFNLVALILLLILKTPVDIYFHNKEHETVEDIQKEKKEITNKIEESDAIVKAIKEIKISPQENRKHIILTIILFVFFIFPLFFGIIGTIIWVIYFVIYLSLMIKPIPKEIRESIKNKK